MYFHRRRNKNEIYAVASSTVASRNSFFGVYAYLFADTNLLMG
jgi:hypothetical protein